MIEVFTNYLPGKQVSTGENWNSTTETSSGGMALQIIANYRLNGIKDDKADITAESDIKTSPNGVPISQGGATITYDDIKGLSKSTLLIDTRTGLLIENKGKSHIAGNLGVSAPGYSMQIPMDISYTTKVVALY
jgi:hypothetical protein